MWYRINSFLFLTIYLISQERCRLLPQRSQADQSPTVITIRRQTSRLRRLRTRIYPFSEPAELDVDITLQVSSSTCKTASS